MSSSKVLHLRKYSNPMKTIPFIIILLCCLSVACRSDKSHQTKTTEPVSESSVVNIKLAPAEFHAKLSTSVGAQLIDVRTPAEVAQGYIEHSQNLNFNGDGFDQKLSGLSKEKPVFVYCRSGNRSGKAALKLKSMGFQKVYDLEGGITDWEDAGMPIEGQ